MFKKGSIPWNKGIKGYKRPEHAKKMRGKKHSIKTRQRQSKSRSKYLAENPEKNLFRTNNPAKWLKVRGILSEQKRGDKNPAKQLKVRTKISEGKRGELNPAWQGGVSFEPYGAEFDGRLKFYVRDRDDFACQFCGTIENGKAFGPHHINYNKKDNRKKNLVLLCIVCNNKANADREKWELCFTVLNEIRHLTYPIGGI